MSRTISYLNPKKYYANPRLDDVLLLVPSYIRPDMRTHQCIEFACALGAEVVSSFGCSDPALHRCLIAGRALQCLKTEHGSKFQYVCWIDDDMVFSPEHIAFLRAACDALQAATTAMYCRRGQPTVVCVRDIPEQDPPIVPRQIQIEHGITGYVPEFTSYPVTSGMGCLMVPRDQFIDHCEAVPSVRNGEQVTPAICSSQMCQDDDGITGWVSEDESYTEALWIRENGVWSVPIAFGHMSNVPLIPAPDAIWLGEQINIATTARTIPAEPVTYPEPEVVSSVEECF